MRNVAKLCAVEWFVPLRCGCSGCVQLNWFAVVRSPCVCRCLELCFSGCVCEFEHCCSVDLFELCIVVAWFGCGCIVRLRRELRCGVLVLACADGGDGDMRRECADVACKRLGGLLQVRSRQWLCGLIALWATLSPACKVPNR